MGKGLTIILGMLAVVVLFWIGMGIYFISSEVKIDPNAETYVVFISPKFKTDGLDAVSERVEGNLPVAPSTFVSLNAESDSEK